MKYLIHLIAAVLLVAVGWGGVDLRRNLWDWTMDIRYNADIDNGFYWGKFADRVGYFNVYDEMGTPVIGRPMIDYGPLRLGVMASWVQWLKPRYADLSRREPSEQFHAPLLWLNTVMEAATAIAAWILVTNIVRRSQQKYPGIEPASSAGGMFVGWGVPVGVGRGFIAAMLVWFNPLILWNAHIWPQWDIWPMPFYLFAVYCACRRNWLLGGVLIGVGAMLKGQLLMVAWTLPVWAIFVGDWRGAFRFIVGVLCALGLGGSVWELSTYMPGQHGFARAAAAHESIRQINWSALVWTLCWLAGGLLLPRRFSATAVCFALGVSLLSTMWLLGGSSHWFESAFEIGTWRDQSVSVGAPNLPALLQASYGFDDGKFVCFTIDVPGWVQRVIHSSPASPGVPSDATAPPQMRWPIDLKSLMLLIYFPLCFFCAAMAARHDRRGDARLAISIGLPWLLFYCLPLQVHERYLLYFSACASLLIAPGVEYALLGAVVTLTGFCITAGATLAAAGVSRDNAYGATAIWSALRSVVGGMQPGIAWLLLLATCIFLYIIIIPTCPPRSAA
jgi:hypothetical protein